MRGEPVAVLGQIDGIRAGAHDGHARLVQSALASFSGVWPPSVTTTPSGSAASTTSMTSSKVSGSKNSMSEVS